jgi:hypothetical protein
LLHKLIVPVRGDGKGDNVLAHAAVLAKNFNAHIVVTHCRPRPEDLLPYGVPIPAFMRETLLKQSMQVADQEEIGLKDELISVVQSLGLEMSEKPTGKAGTVSWVEEAGRQVDIIKHHGRLADLIVVSKPDVDRNLGANTLKAALFHTGRPVLMCPSNESPPTTLGKNIAIAWNGSTESARAIALTLNLIVEADSITIISIGSQVKGASAEDLKKYFSERHVLSEIKRFETSDSIGKLLLEQSKECGADLLIMGAYGDSHERETVFGGNTQYIVDHSEMPVVLVH